MSDADDASGEHPGREGRRARRKRTNPGRWLRPGWVDPFAFAVGPGESLREAVDRISDTAVLEAIEFAGVMAEQAVVPFLTMLRQLLMPGASHVILEFTHADTFASFRRVEAVSRYGNSRSWLLARRWASARGDAELDEAMCTVVATHLNAEYPTRLRAFVETRIC